MKKFKNTSSAQLCNYNYNRSASRACASSGSEREREEGGGGGGGGEPRFFNQLMPKRCFRASIIKLMVFKQMLQAPNAHQAPFQPNNPLIKLTHTFIWYSHTWESKSTISFTNKAGKSQFKVKLADLARVGNLSANGFSKAKSELGRI